MVAISIGPGTHTRDPLCARLCMRACAYAYACTHNLNIHFSNAITIHYSTLNAA